MLQQGPPTCADPMPMACGGKVCTWAALLFADTLANRKNEQSGANENEDDDLALDSIGCTANVVLTDYAARKIYVANAGDSRCVMGHGGKCTPLSFDHKPDC